MKKIFTMIFLMTGLAGLFAETMDIKISNPRVDGSNYKFDIQIKRTDDWKHTASKLGGLGNSDFYFTYNSDAFSGNPSLDNIEPDIEDNPDDYAIEAKINSTRLQVKLEYYKQTMVWQPALNTWETVCTVIWAIDDDTENTELEWDQVNSAFADGDGQEITVDSWLGSGDIYLPVQSLAVQASPGPDGIRITWQGEGDPAVAGYYVLRSREEKGDYSRLTRDLIPAESEEASHTYTYLDRTVESGVLYWYRVEEVDAGGGCRLAGSVCIEGVNTAPKTYALSDGYPNPFNPVMSLDYQVPALSDVTIRIYTLLGQEVRVLVSGRRSPGTYTVRWDGKDRLGRSVSSGVYLIRMQAGRFSKMRKVTLIR